ncbi:SDR family NAD(P)-dependent oxidoreductase [Streptomyces sp. NPDC091271]|uniref:SDR family NAD(P)-dependent oxidoreductase n=1 Tax=Streptomyces sp. NPDC091271 TaxID=3365980 RepID=UPI003800E56F
MNDRDVSPADKLALDGRVAVVTGGGGGIGRGIALALAGAGAAVAVGDIVPERAQETARRIEKDGGTALPYHLDVMDTERIGAMAAATDERFGAIDILVNNAGGVSARPFLEQSERSWRRHIDINLVSALAATSAVVPRMIRGGRGGSVINIGSIEGGRAAPNFAVYAACKAALESFTRTMALELSEHGIRVNAITPDHTVTPGTMGNRSGPVDPDTWVRPAPEAADAMARLIPLGREGDAAECGDAALFLASELASYVTGVVLPVDGGTWAAGGWVRGRDRRWTLNEGLRFG